MISLGSKKLQSVWLVCGTFLASNGGGKNSILVRRSWLLAQLTQQFSKLVALIGVESMLEY